MPKLPTVLATDVIRSAHQGDSHGGAYLVDLETGSFEKVIDYDRVDIDWDGRGQGRGLRGIAFSGRDIIIAASNEIFVFDQSFRIQRSLTCPYLHHCHEIFFEDGVLWATATSFDSVLELDLGSSKFRRAWYLRRPGPPPDTSKMPEAPDPLLYGGFDPEAGGGPIKADTTHINNVWRMDGRTFICGVRLGYVYELRERAPRPYARLPFWTHNARPFRDGILCNSTQGDVIRYQHRNGTVFKEFEIPTYDESVLEHTDLPRDYARQGFGRGLCTTDDGLIIGGSSPSTVAVHDLDSGERVRQVTLTLDIRNAVHGLEIWPF